MLAWQRTARSTSVQLENTVWLSSIQRWSSTRSEHPEYNYDAARDWFRNQYSPDTLSKIGEVTYSRSSGPGGQNVNKLNSKAQLRVPLDQLFPLIPTVLHKGVLSSRYCAGKSSSILIQADDSRKQQANKETCFRKLNELIAEVYSHSVPGETSEEQKQKVERLQKKEKEARLKAKKLHSSKKESRGKPRFD
ncbi:uncharacterized protein A1O9_00026 [Exophiala aquamarina CBS 119918]|uniref:Prokaryotic-type class I peptide chain release factors domain-containing protein n=1 Tax=Exophiala aquamarina CBS 119918 TaxID=1182545 RepID=A0A072PPK8_9EURO|nr:uncharacterized protein A1O9_00026 [Exophiala aquamarina CBS 119918]KEF62054.1 hypothetical protein A1O9_00026 [Exophiala aquamarina CBS 119918]